MTDVDVLIDTKGQLIGDEYRIVAERTWGTFNDPAANNELRYDGTAQEKQWKWDYVDPDWVATLTRDEAVTWTEEADQANERHENQMEGEAARNREQYFRDEADWYEAFAGTSNSAERDAYNDHNADTIEKLCKQVASLTKALDGLTT